MVAGAVAAFFTTAGAQQGVCKEDVETLCNGVQPGEGRILKCLKSNEKKLSPACADYFKQVQQQVKQVSAACEPDVERFCWETPIEPTPVDAPKGKVDIVSCLKKHSEELSGGCKTAVAKAKSGMEKPKQ